MSEVRWIKLTTGMFDDEKIRLIESMPEPDAILIIWIKLIIQAGKTNAGGYIFLSESIPYTDEMLSTIFNRPVNTIRLALRVLQDFEMITINGSGIFINAFEKHQNIEGLERIREQARLRVAKHRENKKLQANFGNVSVTLRNALDKNRTDLDLDLEKNKELDASPSERECLNILKNIHNYPLSYIKDMDFIRQMSVEFPDVDIFDEIKQFAVYVLDKPLTKSSNPRLRLRNWLTNARKFKLERTGKNGQGGGVSIPSDPAGKYRRFVRE